MIPSCHNCYLEDYRPHYNNSKHHHCDRNLQDGRSRPMHCCSCSCSWGLYLPNSNVIVPSDHQQESDDNLLSLSGTLVLSVHPSNPTISFGIQTDSLVDHVYYCFGFHLDENPYTGAYSIKFGNWLEVCQSIGYHQLNGFLSHCQPIQDFLQCLLSTDDPLFDVPTKFWDLNTNNIASLNLATGFVCIEPKKFSDRITCYLIWPVGLHTSRDSSWVLAIDAITALECVYQCLKPHTIDIANFLINQGIPFLTLQCMTSIPTPHTPPPSISNLLGTGPINYKFDIADFSAYQTFCDSILKSKPFCHTALCMGRIVARLAQEIIPNTAALLGPSQDTLEGSQKIMACDDQLFCNNVLSDIYTDLICGVYKISTVHCSIYTFSICLECHWFQQINLQMCPDSQSTMSGSRLDIMLASGPKSMRVGLRKGCPKFKRVVNL